ncbi:MAG: thioredoxin [Chitinivibrionales bacterium]
MSGNDVVEITSSNFEAEALKSEVPVLVDFWAEWCGPCKMLTPSIEAIAQEYKGKIKVGKLNVDNAPEIASRYCVTSIPTLLFIKNGNVVEQHVGMLAKKALAAKIDQALLA